MPVIYLPKDDRASGAIQGALDTYVKTKMYSDDKYQKEAAYKLQTLMELGGQTNEQEITALEQTLRLAPGQLRGIAQLEPTTGIMKIPGRLERESKSALSTFRQKSAIEEELAETYSGPKALREKRTIEVVEPAKTAAEAARLRATLPIQTEAAVGQATQLKQMESNEALSLAGRLDALKQELADKNQPAEMRRAQQLKLQEIETEILGNIEKSKLDPVMKATLEKLAKETEALKQSAFKDEKIGGYYGATTKADELKNKLDIANISANKGGKFDAVKQGEIDLALVKAGIGTMNERGKYVPEAMSEDDPRIEQITKSFTDAGYTVSLTPKETGFWAMARATGTPGIKKDVYITIMPGKMATGGPAASSVKAPGSITLLNPSQEAAYTKLKELPAFKKYTDEQIKEYVKKNY